MDLIGGIEIVKDKDKKNIEEVKLKDQFSVISKELKILWDVTDEALKTLTVGLSREGFIVGSFIEQRDDLNLTQYNEVVFENEKVYNSEKSDEINLVQIKNAMSDIKVWTIWDKYVFKAIFNSICLQWTTNLTIVLMVMIGYIIKGESLFYPIQIVWINLITMTFAIQTISNNFPISKNLIGKPISKELTFASLGIKRIVIHSISQVWILLIWLYDSYSLFGFESNQFKNTRDQDSGLQTTIIFNIFVYMQIFNQLNYLAVDRTINASERLKYKLQHIFALIVQVVIQILLTLLGGELFYCSLLNAKQTMLCISFGILLNSDLYADFY